MKHFILGIIATVAVLGAGSVVYAKYVEVQDVPTYVQFVDSFYNGNLGHTAIAKMYDPYLNVACYVTVANSNISCVALVK